MSFSSLKLALALARTFDPSVWWAPLLNHSKAPGSNPLEVAIAILVCVCVCVWLIVESSWGAHVLDLLLGMGARAVKMGDLEVQK